MNENKIEYELSNGHVIKFESLEQRESWLASVERSDAEIKRRLANGTIGDQIEDFTDDEEAIWDRVWQKIPGSDPLS